MKNKIKPKVLSLLLILAISSVIIIPLTKAQLAIPSANPALDAQQNSADPPVRVANFTTWLVQKGHSLQDFNNLSSVATANLLLSLSGQDMNKSMNQIRQDIFGNSTGPVPVPHEIATDSVPKQESIDQTEISDQMSTDSPTSGQACFVVGIWDYPGTALDSDLIHAQYNGIIYNVNNAGYDYVKTLTNSDAAHEYIWEWLTWLCATYQNVDVYLVGHGCAVLGGLLGFGYCSYDCTDGSGYVTDTSRLYYPSEMIGFQSHPYEYSELRLGLGSFCYAGHFSSVVYQPIDAGHPNLADTKNRVWMGGSGEVAQEYLEYFDIYWSYTWYVQDADSRTAYNTAFNQAAPHQYQYDTVSYYYNKCTEMTQSLTQQFAI